MKALTSAILTKAEIRDGWHSETKELEQNYFDQAVMTMHGDLTTQIDFIKDNRPVLCFTRINQFTWNVLLLCPDCSHRLEPLTVKSGSYCSECMKDYKRELAERTLIEFSFNGINDEQHERLERNLAHFLEKRTDPLTATFSIYALAALLPGYRRSTQATANESRISYRSKNDPS